MDLRAFVPHGRTMGITKTKRRRRLLLVMKLTAFILLAGMLHVSAAGWGQTVTLSEKNVPVQQIFKEISRQTGISILYNEQFLANLSKVTIDVKNATVEQVLAECLKNQPLTWSIQNNKIFIQQISEPRSSESLSPPIDVHGRVTDSTGAPLSGASITVKGSRKGTQTDVNGNFVLKGVGENPILNISYTGYTSKQIKWDGSTVDFVLHKSTNPLDEVVVIPYGTTTQRLNTGDISTVSAKTIEEQPVANALAAMEGRVPGLVITQTTGVPGGGFNVQIRGQNSIANGTNPFYVVDGVPYPSQTLGIINNTLRNGNPLNYINPYDIESIEVLKDADATAIYGSRAANGAILITTKKGKAGSMRFDLNMFAGAGKMAREQNILNTPQYLQMRHEAFANDGASPGPNDHDINGDWDTTRYTDWQKVLVGNTAHYDDAEFSVSGGNTNTQYMIGAGYHRETTVFPTINPGDGADKRASVHFNINSVSTNKKFRISLTGSYLSDQNTVQSQDFYEYALILPPDAPALYNPDGTLNWAPLSPGQAGTWNNPYSFLNLTYKGLTSNLVSNAIMSYELLPGLQLKASFGYTNTQTNETRTNPTTANDPGYNITSGTSLFNATNTHSWIIEPQVNYKLNIGRGVMTALVGSTFEQNSSLAQNFYATGFVSDALLEDIQAATSVTPASTSAEYKYNALFGRINYNWEDKYILNLSARRDGSSRFGPGKQFANFGAIGGAWIFSRENFFQNSIPFISFGKLRASYGTSGNDQIPDYQFLNLYSLTQYPYQNTSGLQPTSLFNTDLAWELNKKLEVGIELGFLKDRITVQASFYQNRCDNQLLGTPVSGVTGFGYIEANLPAVVQNTGQEFVLNTINIKSKNFSWSSSINLTIPQNKLISFPNLANSGFQNTFKIGQSISATNVFHSIGVNDTTGLYEFAGKQGPTYSPDYSTDRTVLINRAPKYYGGFDNNFVYKGFSLDVFFQFVNQTGTNIWAAYQNMPGLHFNQPVAALDRWQKQGDVKPLQQFSQNYGSNAYNQLQYAESSDFIYGDASFIRLKNVSLSYSLPQSVVEKLHLERCRIYFQGQNLFTITNYNGIDPESQGVGLPPLKVYTAGIQLSF